MPGNTQVRFRTINAKSLVEQLAGQEPPYPVYYVGNTVKFERPEQAGRPYRWTRDIEEVNNG